MISTVLTAFALLTAPVFGSPVQMLTVQHFAGEISGRHIVTLKSEVEKSAHLSWLESARLTSGSAVTVTNAEWDSSVLHGYAGEFSEDALNALRASPDVESIEEDGIMHTFATVTEHVQSANDVDCLSNAPWGLARLSTNNALTGSATALTYSYQYDSSAGAGVDIYVVDTGISTTHSDFGGRARLGAVFGSSQNVDGNGHGTHVSGTAAGTRWGVAKAASLIAVKVLNDGGSGTVSDIVSGLNFVATSARSSGRPSIATMSLGGSASTALDSAVSSIFSMMHSVHVTVAAGNSATNAANTSPARVATANTIGASSITDAIASFSNFGSVVDLFAPGVSVTSSWIGSSTATNTISGTSMATPHVAGLIAYLIGRNGNSSPAAISTTLKNLAVSGALSGIPSGTANLLARNDI
ncbi:serine protease [Vararia minispora EC-137]|uniref:Serine protease n=1 Tax=Vararia minispora EC-137 TaxID=1314806 RepID=A0ACB8QLQ6_9AGAM|nr:serine protease [Vararia minispora EC-137]